MKRNVKRILIGISAITLLGGSLVACGHKYKSPQERVQWITEKVASKLDLNESQKMKFDNLAGKLVEAKEAHQKDRDTRRQEAMSLLEGETFDQQKALSMVKQHTNFINQQAPTVVNAYADFHNALTPEQRAKISEHLQEHFEHRGRWGHH